MFNGIAKQEEIIDAQVDRYDHAGLAVLRDDRGPLIDYAFATGNVELWAWFVPSHHFYAKEDERGPDPLRRYARLQSRNQPAFLARSSLLQRRQAEQWADKLN